MTFFLTALAAFLVGALVLVPQELERHGRVAKPRGTIASLVLVLGVLLGAIAAGIEPFLAFVIGYFLGMPIGRLVVAAVVARS